MTVSTLQFSEFRATDPSGLVVNPATITGGGGLTTWTDGSDATYATHTTAVRSDYSAFHYITAKFDPVPGIVTLNDFNATLRSRARKTGGAVFLPYITINFYLQLTAAFGDEYGDGIDYRFTVTEKAQGQPSPIEPSALDVIEAKTGLKPDNNDGSQSLAASLATARTALTEGGWVLMEFASVSTTPPADLYLDVYEFQVEYDYTGTAPPPLRRYPRDDGRGFGGVKRNYPQSKASRNVGGQP